MLNLSLCFKLVIVYLKILYLQVLAVIVNKEKVVSYAYLFMIVTTRQLDCAYPFLNEQIYQLDWLMNRYRISPLKLKFDFFI